MAHRNARTLRAIALRVAAPASAAALLALLFTPTHAVRAASDPGVSGATPHASATSPALVSALDAELKRAMSSLGKGDEKEPKPYFLSYAVSDGISDTVS